MLKIIIPLTVFSGTLLLLNYVLEASGLTEILHHLNCWMIGYFWLINVLIHFAADFLQKNLEMELTLVWLGAVTARLLIALFTFLIVAMIMKENLMIFAANFSAIYLSFLVFEIISVLSNLRRNSRLERTND